jgi:plasmid stabilization system protein ParE
MPQRAWNAKRERQYDHIKKSAKKRGASADRAEEIAARTVNRERARAGEAGNSSRLSRTDMSLAVAADSARIAGLVGRPEISSIRRPSGRTSRVGRACRRLSWRGQSAVDGSLWRRRREPCARSDEARRGLRDSRALPQAGRGGVSGRRSRRVLPASSMALSYAARDSRTSTTLTGTAALHFLMRAQCGRALGSDRSRSPARVRTCGWVPKAEVDAGERPGLSGEEAAEIREVACRGV